MHEHESIRTRLENALAGIPRRGTEASFKLAPGQLLASRGLIGIDKRFVAADTLFRIARDMNVPQRFVQLLAAEYSRANFFYFGYEEGPASALKLYVEYPVLVSPLTPGERDGPDSSRPSLQLRGYKWNAASQSEVAVTDYVWYVHLPRARMLERMRALSGGAHAEGFGLVRNLIEKARASRPPPYIEATEPGNPRVSYDINLYDEKLSVDVIAEAISRLGRAYGIDPSALAGALRDAHARPLGHLSGGVGRDNREFLTVYYEI